MQLPIKNSAHPRLINILYGSLVGGGLAIFGLYLLEAIFYPGAVAARLGISLLPVTILYLLFLAMVKFIEPPNLIKQAATSTLLYFSPALAMSSLFLDFANDVLFDNFSFSTFHLHPVQLHLAGMFLALFCLFLADWRRLLANWQRWLFGSSLIVFTLVAYLKRVYLATWFHTLRAEDGLFEYFTAIGFFIGGVIMLRIARHLWQTKNYNWRNVLLPFCVLVGLALCVIAMEEISWGQRIFNFQTPQFIADSNTQDEITIHNNEAILPYVYYGYFIVSLYGFISPLIKLVIKRYKLLADKFKIWLEFIMPDWYSIPLFLPTLYYTSYRLTIGWEYYEIGQWEETTEMFLGAAAAVFALGLYNKVVRQIRS